MGRAVELTAEESALRREIEERLARCWASLETRRPEDDLPKQIAEMGDLATKLHQSLASRGVKPKHHKYMLKNREVPVSDPEFYRHIHPVQDLLKFIDDMNANDDPVDMTIGHDFDLPVYSRRWGHEESYHLKRTKSGWEFRHFHSGACDKRGAPLLYDSLDHDSINYPEELGGYLEYLWERAEKDGLSHEQVQEALTVLGRWIITCEQSSPEGIWTHYK